MRDNCNNHTPPRKAGIRKLTSKILSLALCTVLMLTLLPTVALAQPQSAIPYSDNPTFQIGVQGTGNQYAIGAGSSGYVISVQSGSLPSGIALVNKVSSTGNVRAFEAVHDRQVTGDHIND